MRFHFSRLNFLNMYLFRHHNEVPSDCQGAVVALGNFDGVHLGHREVIGQALALARAKGCKAGVMTFDPHPRRLFQPELPPFTLSPFRIKTRLIESLGADWLLVEHFDAAYAAQSAEVFIREVLQKGIQASHVVVGERFAFGRGRGGSVETLRESGAALGLGVTAVPSQGDGAGLIYSSSRIRQALETGEPSIAAAILGRPWEIDGRVEHGDARGRTLGFPTANIRLGEYQRPAVGVYAVRAGVDRGAGTEWRPGVANFGHRPTFDKTDELLEVHLFDTDADLYGLHLRVQFVEFLRSERKFSGLEALVEQIRADAVTARRVLGA